MNLLHRLFCCFITLFLPASIRQSSGGSLKRLGKLTVEPSPTFLQGSDLTFHCHLFDCRHRFKLILEVEGVSKVRRGASVNCTTTFHLYKVTTPSTNAVCKLEEDKPKLVDGLTLHSGLRPDKPKNVSCETTAGSDFIECSWDKGRETHVETTYNVALSREAQFLEWSVHTSCVKLPRWRPVDATLFQLRVSARNIFGVSHSEVFSLCVNSTACSLSLTVVPETPQIKQVTFMDSEARLELETHDDSRPLTLLVNLSKSDGFWELKKHTIIKDMIQVVGLEPLSEYKFQVRSCDATSEEELSRCSKWSLPSAGRTAGRGPSKALQTWRIAGDQGKNGLRTVTVMWKALPAGEFSGELLNYKINMKDKEEVKCAAAQSQCDVQVPSQVQALGVSAVTSYGISPPARVLLTRSAGPGPAITDVSPSDDEGSVLVSWSYLTNPGDVLYFVVEWTRVPANDLWWKVAAADQNTSSITGLTAGVRFRVSLYAVTLTGVSAPSSRLFYCRELKPLLGPSVTVVVHESRQVWIQWSDAAVDQQRGFLTHYTVYVHTLEPHNSELVVTVSASVPRQKELNSPEGPLAIQMSASTSAGEGPRGGLVSSHPKPPTSGLMTVLVIISSIFITLIANLLCWRCLRKSMKEKCMSWELSNSKAIRLLEQEEVEPIFPPSLEDPPLSPITWVQDQNDVYPTIQTEANQNDSDGRPLSSDHQPEHVGYKPQVSTLAAQRADDDGGTEAAVVDTGEEGGSTRLVVSFLDVHVTDVSLELSPDLFSDSSTADVPTNLLQSSRRNIDVASVVVESQSEDDLPPADHSPPDTVQILLTGGYFPQTPTANLDDHGDSQR